MARGVRIEFAGALYHVMCRGDRRERIFLEDSDSQMFLRTLGEACARSGFVVHAYVLMGNHYHLLLETPQPNLVAGMGWFQTTYTARFNRRHRLVGHLFQGRYKSMLIDGADGASFRRVADYIHLNPARARLLDRDHPRLEAYAWSSHPVYAGEAERPDWLYTDRLTRTLGLDGLTAAEAARLQRERMAGLVADVLDRSRRDHWRREWAELRAGWCLGGTEFRESMRKRANRLVGRRKPGSLLDHARREQEAVLAEEKLSHALRCLGLTLEQLQAMKTTDPRKEVVAWWMKTQTAQPNRWIADRLSVGHPSRLCHLVRAVVTANSGPREELKRVIHSTF